VPHARVHETVAFRLSDGFATSAERLLGSRVRSASDCEKRARSLDGGYVKDEFLQINHGSFPWQTVKWNYSPLVDEESTRVLRSTRPNQRKPSTGCVRQYCWSQKTLTKIQSPPRISRSYGLRCGPLKTSAGCFRWSQQYTGKSESSRPCL